MRKARLTVPIILLVYLILLVSACGNTSTITAFQAQNDNSEFMQVKGTLQVHYLDVGQGDCILIKASDGTSILIDRGNNSTDLI